MAYPLTMAITGFGMERICFCTSSTFRRGNSVSAYVSTVAFHVHVASGAESLVASSCQYDDIDVLTLTAVIQCVTDFSSGGRSERIAVSRAVDGILAIPL